MIFLVLFLISAVVGLDQVYIVVFHPNSTASQRERHLQSFPLTLRHTYEVRDFHGYAAVISPSIVQKISVAPEVAFVEQDGIVRITDECHQQTDATWGLDRINEQQLNLDGEYSWTYNGEGTNSYVIDTGIYVENDDFEGRAEWGANFVTAEVEEDCNGHGTHVAGTIGSKTWGVAKKTTLIAVKVLSCSGSGSRADILKSIEWVVIDAKQRKGRSVANMSIGGTASEAYNLLVDEAVKSGIVFAVAAGNENQNACTRSPAGAPLAITVGSTAVGSSATGNQYDIRSSFSNWGSCVDIFAPGSLITSTWIGARNATKTISGTSMATPHVAGVAALFVGSNPDVESVDVVTHLNEMANVNMITLSCDQTSVPTKCKESPNRLLYKGFCN